jgi:hypothetical protein
LKPKRVASSAGPCLFNSVLLVDCSTARTRLALAGRPR